MSVIEASGAEYPAENAGDEKFINAQSVDTEVDQDGDVMIIQTHDCGCCHTVLALDPEAAERLADLLKFNAVAGFAIKAGLSTGEQGCA